MGVGDVGTKFKELAFKGIGSITIGAVHHLGQHVQTVSGGYDVGMIFILAGFAVILAPEGRPVGGVGLVAVRAGRDGDGCLRRIPVATSPASKGVACPDWFFQRESCRLVGIAIRIGSGHSTVGQVVGDSEGVIGIDRDANVLIDSLASATEFVASQILNGAADAVHGEGCTCTGRNCAGKGEDVGTGASVA